VAFRGQGQWDAATLDEVTAALVEMATTTVP